MKHRIASKVKPKSIIKDHERLALDAMFAEAEDDVVIHVPPTPTQEFDIHINEPSVVDEVFDIETYGLEDIESLEIGEGISREVALKFHDLLVTTMSTLSGLKAAEEIVGKKYETKLSIVTKEFLNDITIAMIAKIKTMIIEGMDFSDEQAAAVFMKVVVKEGSKVMNPLNALESYLNGDDTDAKTGPYAVSATKSFKTGRE